jgi:hypothetical protein
MIARYRVGTAGAASRGVAQAHDAWDDEDERQAHRLAG